MFEEMSNLAPVADGRKRLHGRSSFGSSARSTNVKSVRFASSESLMSESVRNVRSGSGTSVKSVNVWSVSARIEHAATRSSRSG